MNNEQELSPEVREQLLETLRDMNQTLQSIEPLAESRGRAGHWWDLVCEMLRVQRRVEHGPLGDDFADAMQGLSSQYDLFVQTVLPDPGELS